MDHTSHQQDQQSGGMQKDDMKDKEGGMEKHGDMKGAEKHGDMKGNEAGMSK